MTGHTHLGFRNSPPCSRTQCQHNATGLQHTWLLSFLLSLFLFFFFSFLSSSKFSFSRHRRTAHSFSSHALNERDNVRIANRPLHHQSHRSRQLLPCQLPGYTTTQVERYIVGHIRLQGIGEVTADTQNHCLYTTTPSRHATASLPTSLSIGVYIETVI